MALPACNRGSKQASKFNLGMKLLSCGQKQQPTEEVSLGIVLLAGADGLSCREMVEG